MLKKICGILSTLVLIAIAAIAAALIVPHFLGYQSMAVVSGSMEPNIHVGAVAYVKEIPFEELEVGDIISYHLSQDTVVTHRIVKIDDTEKQIVTKGDANDTEDGSPVSGDNIIGKVRFNIPLLGYISMYAKTPLGIAGICAVFMVLILLNFLPEIFSKEKNENQEK